MKTKNLGIEINQNSDFSVILYFSNVNGAIDISDYAFKGQIRPTTEVDDPISDPVAEFVFTIQDQITDKGKVKWALPAASSKDVVLSVATPLTNKRQTTPFVYDVYMKDDLGITTKIIQGIIYISPRATQEDL